MAPSIKALLIITVVLAAPPCLAEVPSTQPTSTPASVPSLSAPAAGADFISPDEARRAGRLINRGIAYLLAQRDADGGWSIQGANKPAITAMTLKALIQGGELDSWSEVVRRGFEALLRYRQEDGGIYEPSVGLANYSTSLAVMAMAAADDPSLRPEMDRCLAFLRGEQIVPGAKTPDGKTVGADHPFVGGVSYGEHGRPDLSNVGMWMDAFQEAGVPGSDPAVQRALAFVSRVQNRSESNPMVWAAAGDNDGGFAYAPSLTGESSEGESKAGGEAGKGLRSYGSMTYVGFKNLLYATLDAKVCPDGSWVNEADRWMESSPVLVTAYSVLALQETLKR